MKNKKNMIAALTLGCSLLAASSASAFSDVQGADAAVITSLQSKGVIQGVSEDKFAPQGKLTSVQGVHLIVKALQLKAADVTLQNPNAPWYAESLDIAAKNGLPVELAADPSAELTREQFAQLLYKGIQATGDYPLIKMYIRVADEDQMTPLYQGSIQNLLLMKVATLDDKSLFHPQDRITRMEAAGMIAKAIEFTDRHKEQTDNQENQEVSFTIEKINADINKIVLTRREQPSPGYGIAITNIEMNDSGHAKIRYKLTSPEPGKMYPQVLWTSKTETYLSSKYKVEIQAN
ncbi:S-layer homology domain-containing protein [Paenibacillus chitinolyticus]|uniref:S-layer homology domain-containing protein n=1 Tax=Paenibacillus chitinolyticus TaxID=79263 RepID=UPI0035585DF9